MADLITPQQLADRWQMSVGTLTNWRVKKQGPTYVKLGDGKSCRIMYRLADIDAFEQSHVVKEL